MQVQYNGHVLSLQAHTSERLRVVVELEAAAGCGAEPLVFAIPRKLAERMMPGDPVYLKLGAHDEPR